MGVIGPESRRQLQLAARFATAGLELAITIVVGYFGGGLLDGWLDTKPYLAYGGLVLGIVAGFRSLFKLARTAQQQAEKNPQEPNEPPAP